MELAMVTGPGLQLEAPRVFTPLGIQFWDLALDTPVTDGLSVAAQLKDSRHRPVPGFRTVSGVYAFQGLPGLHDVEYPAAETTASSSPPKTLSFVITIADRLGRFLPMLFAIDLPLPYRGLFLSNETGSPAGLESRAYLFSAPTRPAGPGMALVRADLWDVDTRKPASFAALRVRVDGRVWTGITDDQGRALIMFPQPLVQPLGLGSPPGSGQGSVSSMTWPVKVEVQYGPEQLRFPLATTPDVPWPWNRTPSLKSILDEQPPGLIWVNDAGPPVAEWTGNLAYGEELVLRTAVLNAPTPSPYFWISRSTSSP